MKKTTLVGLVISLNSLTASAEDLKSGGIVELSSTEDIGWLDGFFDDDGIIEMPYFSKEHQKSHSRDYSRSF